MGLIKCAKCGVDMVVVSEDVEIDLAELHRGPYVFTKPEDAPPVDWSCDHQPTEE